MEQTRNGIERFGGSRHPRMWSGIILLIAGILLLAYKMGAPIPGWILTWPVLLIVIGLIVGIKSRFHNPGAFIMIIIGGIFLIDQTQPQLDFHNYIIPAILISIGLVYIFKPRPHFTNRSPRRWRRMYYENQSKADITSTDAVVSKNDIEEEGAEHIEINVAFGSVKKIILSKNFKGGEINCFMGGSEINLMKADIQKPITLEVNTVFGGAKLIIPSNWDVKNEVTAVFGGIEDKRIINSGIPDPQKIIVLKGTCVFGGIEIANY